MDRDKLWHVLDDIATEEAPRQPALADLVAAAGAARRRRSAAAVAGAAVACVAVVGVVSAGAGLFASPAARPSVAPPAGAAPVGSVTVAPAPVAPSLGPATRPPGPAPTLSPLASVPPMPEQTSGSPATPSPARPTTPPPARPAVPVQVDVAGLGSGKFAADRGYSGGNTVDFPDRPVTADGVVGAAPIRAYQSCRWAASFSYRLAGLQPGVRYVLRLHWAELDFEGAGERVFAVAVDGRTVLPRVDVVAATGARWRAMVREVPFVAGPTGAVTVALSRAGPDNPFLCALEAVPAG